MCDKFGITPYTFLICLCVQPRFIEIYGSSGSVGSFVEGAALRQIYSMTGCVRKVGRDTIRFTYHRFQKDYSLRVHDALSSSQRLLRQARAPHRCIKPGWLLISKLLNPRPADPANQDALGLITVYPRPDEHFIIFAAAPAVATPSITAFLLGRTPRLQRLSQPFSIKEHFTILC